MEPQKKNTETKEETPKEYSYHSAQMYIRRLSTPQLLQYLRDNPTPEPESFTAEMVQEVIQELRRRK